jgi:hypothetical protein
MVCPPCVSGFAGAQPVVVDQPLRIQEFALTVTDEEALAELRAMVLELERRARELGNGDPIGSMERRATHDISSDPAGRRPYSVEMISPTGKQSLIENFAIRRKRSHGSAEPGHLSIHDADTAERDDRLWT